jgi:hypothetical protein
MSINEAYVGTTTTTRTTSGTNAVSRGRRNHRLHNNGNSLALSNQAVMTITTPTRTLSDDIHTFMERVPPNCAAIATTTSSCSSQTLLSSATGGGDSPIFPPNPPTSLDDSYRSAGDGTDMNSEEYTDVGPDPLNHSFDIPMRNRRTSSTNSPGGDNMDDPFYLCESFDHIVRNCIIITLSIVVTIAALLLL